LRVTPSAMAFIEERRIHGPIGFLHPSMIAAFLITGVPPGT